MSKMHSSVVIALLVAVACANQAQATPFNQNFTETIHSVKEEIVILINKTIHEIKESVANLNKLVTDTFKTAKDVAANSSQHIANDYNQAMNQITTIINSNPILSEECQRAIDAFRTSYQILVQKMNDCTDSRIQSGVNNLNEINELANKVIHELTNLRNEAISCTARIDGIAQFYQALKCVNVAAVKTSIYVAKQIPPLTLQVTKLGANILLLPPQIGYCFSTRFINVVGSNYKETLHRVNQCIMNSDTTTTVPPFTEY